MVYYYDIFKKIYLIKHLVNELTLFILTFFNIAGNINAVCLSVCPSVRVFTLVNIIRLACNYYVLMNFPIKWPILKLKCVTIIINLRWCTKISCSFMTYSEKSLMVHSVLFVYMGISLFGKENLPMVFLCVEKHFIIYSRCLIFRNCLIFVYAQCI